MWAELQFSLEHLAMSVSHFAATQCPITCWSPHCLLKLPSNDGLLSPTSAVVCSLSTLGGPTLDVDLLSFKVSKFMMVEVIKAVSV